MDPGGNSEVSGDASNEWQRYQPTPVFSFLAPADLERSDAQPVDSAAGIYQSPGLEIVFDYGWYADPLDDATRDIRSREHVTIGGRDALLVENGAGAAIHFPNVSGDNSLTVTVRWNDPESAATGMEILRSIRFR